MSSVDLKDAYYSIAIHKDFIKFLKLFWEGQYFAFQCLPNGYGPALRMFTKVLKQPFGYLRSQGHQSVVYIDDSYLQGHSFEACQENVWVTFTCFKNWALLFTRISPYLFPRKSGICYQFIRYD